MTSTMSQSPPPTSFAPVVPTSTKMKRRSSYDVLQGIAGPESSLPLPRRDGVGIEEGGIREGIPMNFGVGPVSPTAYKRVSSPTRTLSRTSLVQTRNLINNSNHRHTSSIRGWVTFLFSLPSPSQIINMNNPIISNSGNARALALSPTTNIISHTPTTPLDIHIFSSPNLIQTHSHRTRTDDPNSSRSSLEGRRALVVNHI